MNIARTTLSSKLLNTEKNHFAELAVDAVLRLKGTGNLEHIQVCHATFVGVRLIAVFTSIVPLLDYQKAGRDTR